MEKLASSIEPINKKDRRLGFTMVPNELLESDKLDPAEKLIWCLLFSCNPSFPSYNYLMKKSGLSRDKVWKSLRKLEEYKLIFRYKNDKSIYYDFYKFTKKRKIKGTPVRYTDRTSPPDGLDQSVQQTLSILSNKTK